MKQPFHFEHHRKEAIRNRRRFTVLNGLLFAGVAVLVGAQYAASHAATSTYGQIDGVKIDTSGAGQYGGGTTGTFSTVNVNVIQAGTTGGRNTTSNPFYFQSLPATTSGVSYIVSVNQTTAGNYRLKGYTYEDGNVAGWNAQTTNFHTGSSATFNLRSDHQIHLRWIWQYVPPATPAPTATPRPVTPAPTPVRTATPVRTPVKTPVPGVGAVPAPTPVAPDTTAPAAPGGFQALASSDNAVVKLSWTAATDNVGVSSYHLERSTDQTTWSVVSDGSDLNYQDATAAFGVHYYYRVSAFDAAGNQSPYATGDATTATFNGSSSTAALSVTSSDGLVAVSVPSGAFDTDADCTVDTSDTAITAGKSTIIAGPYEIICKDSSGNQLITLKNPLTWTYNIKAKMKGFKNPSVATVDNTSTQSAIKSYVYNSKTGLISFSAASLNTTAILASVKPGFPVSIVVFSLIFLGLIAALVIWFLRRSQKQNYDEYIRSKYYDL